MLSAKAKSPHPLEVSSDSERTPKALVKRKTSNGKPRRARTTAKLETKDDESTERDPEQKPAWADIELQDGIERQMLSWPQNPERFVSILEAWTRKARDHFRMKGTEVRSVLFDGHAPEK